MKNGVKRYKSIYVEAVLLFIIAAMVAGIFFMLTSITVDGLLTSYMEKTDYSKKQSDKYAESLQEFVNENEISFENLEKIEGWIKENPIVLLNVYDDGYLIYDSVGGYYVDKKYFREKNETLNYYNLDFTDKSVEVCIYGSFDYEISNTIETAEIILTFGIFLVVFMIGLRQKIKYIHTLREEVDVLEGGNLDYPISVVGDDEIAELASGLDSMRISFKNQMNETENLARTNQTMVTQISHDLRTPLTAVQLYAEILNNSRDLSDEQKKEYLDKLLKKISHMKDLSDHLLTYSAKAAAPEISIELLPAKQVLYDELSELCGYLEEQGFCLETEFDWGYGSIAVNEEYVSRILNNISSNILKYAERTKPVYVLGQNTPNGFRLTFRNSVAENYPTSESNKIGIQSIRALMAKLGGKCEVRKVGNSFETEIEFKDSV